MAVGRSNIEWTDATWGPLRGCSRYSPGCDRCYAIRGARRFDVPGGPYEGLTRVRPAGTIRLDWSGVVREVPEAMEAPLRWRRPRRIFVASMSDPFHHRVAEATLTRIWDVMRRCPQHRFQLLTKRADRMRAWVSRLGIVLPNVWLGVSAEDQATASERLPILLDTPAAVRFASLEPLLGPIDLIDAQASWLIDHIEDDHAGVAWVIVGGESGPGARPCEIAWIRSIVRDCARAKVPCFVKQLGRYPLTPDGVVLMRDPKGGDMTEWPHDLRVRQYPD